MAIHNDIMTDPRFGVLCAEVKCPLKALGLVLFFKESGDNFADHDLMECLIRSNFVRLKKSLLYYRQK